MAKSFPKSDGREKRLTAYEFTVALLAALARRGVTGILAPERDTEQLSDRAASATWHYLEDHFGDQFDCAFCVYTHPIYRDSSDWRRALHECGMIFIVPQLDTGMLKLIDHDLEWGCEDIAGTMETWDKLAEVFLEEYENARKPEGTTIERRKSAPEHTPTPR